MTGMQHTHTQQNGRMSIDVVAISLICVIVLSGCSSTFMEWFVGDGRGDWSVQLIDEYVLFKTSSRSVEICRRENPTDTNCSFVMTTPFFVTAIQVDDPFIAVEGIPTSGPFITEEELRTDTRHYYLIDADGDNLYGPYVDLDAFLDYCISVGYESNEIWIKVNSKSSKPPEIVLD